MSHKLIESILDKNFVVAESDFRDRLNTIKEHKLLEMKKMMQAEAFGGLTRDEIEARKAAGWPKAADVWHDPRGETRKVPIPVVKKKNKNQIPLPDMKKERKISEASSMVNKMTGVEDKFKDYDVKIGRAHV